MYQAQKLQWYWQEVLKQQNIGDNVNRLTKSNDNQWKELVSDNNDCINKDYSDIRQDLINDAIKPTVSELGLSLMILKMSNDGDNGNGANNANNSKNSGQEGNHEQQKSFNVI